MQVDGEFVKEYGRLLETRLLAEGVARHDIQDYMGLVYERLLTNFSYDEERGPLTTWLGWVVKSVVSNQRKKESRSQDALDHSIDLDAANNTIGAEDAGEAKDELNRILYCASSTGLVSDRDVSIFKAHHLGGHTSEELSKRYNITSRSIEDIVYRTMKALRELAAG